MNARIVVICGSLRYLEEMMQVAYELHVIEGKIVLPPIADPSDRRQGWATAKQNGVDLTALHKQMIDISDEVVVVGRHVGIHTREEISHALLIGKPIKYTHGSSVVDNLSWSREGVVGLCADCCKPVFVTEMFSWMKGEGIGSPVHSRHAAEPKREED